MATKNLLLDVPAALKKLQLGRTHLYSLIDSGVLVRVKIGQRTFITTESVDTYIEGLIANAANAAQAALQTAQDEAVDAAGERTQK